MLGSSGECRSAGGARVQAPGEARPNLAWILCRWPRYDSLNRSDLLSDRQAAAMYHAVTRKIEVNVTPRFLPERSSVEKSYFFWSYTIEIRNLGDEVVQLKTRHWKITDAFGRVQEVKGAGVVGEEP